jgi:plasmid stability protein
MANLTIKDLPDKLRRDLKKLAEREGRSLNNQVMRTPQDGLAFDARRRVLEAGRKRLREYAARLEPFESSVDLIREDRESH